MRSPGMPVVSNTVEASGFIIVFSNSGGVFFCWRNVHFPTSMNQLESSMVLLSSAGSTRRLSRVGPPFQICQGLKKISKSWLVAIQWIPKPGIRGMNPVLSDRGRKLRFQGQPWLRRLYLNNKKVPTFSVQSVLNFHALIRFFFSTTVIVSVVNLTK